MELPLRKRIYYGMGGLTMNLPDLVIMQWLLVRYVPPDGHAHLVPAAAFGFLLLLGRMTEGISNPFVGYWSDRCHSRFGRRLPFLRLGILPFVLVFFLLFTPPVAHQSWVNVAYALLLFPLYFFLYTTIVTPYLALLPEITSDPKERVDLTTTQSVFIMAGTFVFAAMGLILERWGWTILAGTVATLALLSFLPVATRIQEKPHAQNASRPPLPFAEALRLTLANRPFRYVLLSTSLFWYGLNGLLVLLPHWVVVYLGRTEGDVTWLMAPFLGVNLAFFFVFNALAGRFGKYPLMLATFLCGGVALCAFSLVGRMPLGDPFAQTIVVMALFGIPAAGFMVVPFAVLADVVDYDEQRTGLRREAIYFGVQGIAQKVMIGLSVLTFTLLQAFSGESGAASPAGLKAMALLCSVACFAAFAAFVGYPLRERHGTASSAD